MRPLKVGSPEDQSSELSTMHAIATLVDRIHLTMELPWWNVIHDMIQAGDIDLGRRNICGQNPLNDGAPVVERIT